MEQHLTPREQDVLEALLSGASNQAIADRLSLSINTVKTHLKSIYQKEGVRNRQALIIKALGQR